MQDRRTIAEKIEKAIQKEGNWTIIHRGQDHFESFDINLHKFNKSSLTFAFVVQSSNFYTQDYTTTLSFNEDFTLAKWSCNCKYSPNGFCKHAVASGLRLIEHLQDETLDIEKGTFFQPIYIDTLKDEDIDFIEHKGWKTRFNTINKKNQISTSKPEQGKVHAIVKEDSNTFSVLFSKEKNTFGIKAACDCGSGETPCCFHIYAVAKKLQQAYGHFALHESLSYDLEKQQIVKHYGIPADEDYSKYIDFEFQHGKLTPVPKHKDFVSGSLLNRISIKSTSDDENFTIVPKEKKFDIGYVIYYSNFYKGSGLYFDTFTGKYNQKGELKSNVKIVDPRTYNSEYELIATANDVMIGKLIYNFSKSYQHKKDMLYQFDEIGMKQKHEQLEEILHHLKGKNTFINTLATYPGDMKGMDMKSVEISDEKVRSVIDITQENQFIRLSCHYYIGEQEIDIKDNFILDYSLIVQDDLVYNWLHPSHVIAPLLMQGEKGNSVVMHKSKLAQVFDLLKKVQHGLTINYNLETTEKIENVTVQQKVIFSESGNFLILKPAMCYNGYDVKVEKSSGAEKLNISENGKVKVIERDIEKEQELWNYISESHPSFSAESNLDYFFINAGEVMKKMWFVRFCQSCKDNGIELYGVKKLTKIKYYPGTARISYNYSSNTDWFNMDVNIQFGDELVTLKDVQKAVLKNDGLVKLSDDSLGVLPEEWIKKWKTALEFGKIKDNRLQLTKSQFSLVHALYEEIDNDELYAELSKKLTLLENFEKLEPVPKPAKLNATLRDYQHEGLNWMAFLTTFGFGGCLADDMGLGKTVQMLALLSYLKQKKKHKEPSIVVCPTTLLFNWVKEIQKFCPSLTYYQHWGATRETDIKKWPKTDIVFTSYGTLVNDIKDIGKKKFTAVILDESQAIKNLDSLRFKAVCLVNSDYKFSMTGTPIENNTMELFSQMQFLNPGLLGSANYFKKEFATPIDKGTDPQKAEQLRKLIYPFLLRRTKEVVASELPEKTEMVLLCEMKEEQRKVYDAFVHDYKNKIISEIDAEGMGKARFTILDALLNARQICDSPALLNTEENFGDESIKADELLRNVKEKTKNHKVLVFSQFVGMLTIIKKKFDEAGIKYSYLDGSTTKREEAVNEFVEDETKRVFLISLKAGGFGLNLTVADYVYLVDPWWNPAVESQAIDRVHRIGQDKKVFAYRMICKDTIEEKILTLQEKKKNLADDIVSSEQSLVKNLTKEDIEELFA